MFPERPMGPADPTRPAFRASRLRMAAAGLLVAALLASGPNGLQVLHSPTAEQARQDQILERLGHVDPNAPKSARQPEPPSADEKRAAAWRADHLTCASRKGRTR